jgi:hypothetical protein
VKDITTTAQQYVVRERSDYQLRHFVVGQHDTPQMQFRQILLEVKALLTNIALAELDLEKTQIKLTSLTEHPLDKVKAKKLRLQMALINDALSGAQQELAFLLDLAQEYPQYSPAEIEANQPDYWKARLHRQAALDQLSVQEQVSSGNLTSLLNAGLLHREITT